METALAIPEIPQDQLARAGNLAVVIIDSQEKEVLAIDGLAFVQAVLRGLEKERVKMKEKPLEECRKIDAGFAAVKAPFVGAESALKVGINTWRIAESKRIADEQTRIARENQERERRAREEEDRLRLEKEAQVKQDAEAAGMTREDGEELARLEAADVAAVVSLTEVAPATRPSTVTGGTGRATDAKVWCFEITDEASVPPAYKVIDDSKIRRAIGAGVREIPGVRIFEDIVIRGGRAR